MSGFAAIYNLNQQPLSLTTLAKFADIVNYRGPHASGHWRSNCVGLAHRALHSTPESIAEPQPFKDHDGFVIVLDGRVDNRRDLLKTIRSRGADVMGSGDAELILSAYRCLGAACPAAIIGDFSFVVWDPRSQELFCARDPLGIKPFFYHTSPNIFLAGSELSQILRQEPVTLKLNEGMIGEYLACAINAVSETLYKDVCRLPPAHSLFVGKGGIRISRYFDINAGNTIRYANDEEYAEHFSELFNEAVRCRLRSTSGVGVFLSGGLDSSSVAMVASHLVKSDPVSAVQLSALSLVFPGQQDCDESSYIDEVVRVSGLRGYQLLPTLRRASQYTEDVARFRDFPAYPNGVMSDSLSELARENGVRVVLTGLGGDEWLMGSYYHYADFLKSLQFTALRRQLFDDAAAADRRVSWRGLLRFGFWPLLPQALQRRVGVLLGSKRLPPWIDADFARRTCLADRLRTEPPSPEFPTFAQKDLYQVFASGWRIHALEMEDRSAAKYEIEQRHPFSDRRILEFAFALPEEQRWKDRKTKYVLRNAMNYSLPDSVRLRRTKAEFSSVFTKTFQMNGGKYLFRDLPIAAEGWIKQDVIEHKYGQMEEEMKAGDHRYTRHTCPLWMIFGINLWFESLSANSSLCL